MSFNIRIINNCKFIELKLFAKVIQQLLTNKNIKFKIILAITIEIGH